jgi:two-component system, NtrC family, nitrogen regulation sensor histidine kinase NtrY
MRMRVVRGTSTSFTTVASLAVLYLTVVVLAVILSRELLRGSETFRVRFGGLFVLLGLLFVVTLLGVVGFNVIRLLRERRQGVPGSTLKSRLSIFFIAVVLMVSLPQGIVSVSFLSSATEMLFSTGTASALQEGLQLSLEYYDRHVHDLEQVAIDGTLAEEFEQFFPESPAALLSRLRERLPLLAAVQVFDSEGEELFFTGTDRLRLIEPVDRPETGAPVVNRLSVGGEGMLRLVTPIEHRQANSVVLTTELPARLEATARNLTMANSAYEQLAELRPTFVLFVGLVYGVFAAPILLMAVLASFFLSNRITRPIESLEEATRRVAEGDYSVRILGRPNDDLGLLVLSFNSMVTDLDRARRRMAQAEKVQAWQEIAQRLAHEVKNPLTPIRLAAERLRRRYQAGAEDFEMVLDRTVDTIVREVDALATLLDEFRSFARMPRPSPEPVRIAELLREAAAVYREDPRVTIDTSGADDGDGGPVVPVDRGQLRQVIVNLITNAVEAAGARVTVMFRTGEIRKNTVRYCRLRVEDDGPGIPEDLGRSVFEPYVTSKPDGTGLGLAIVQRIVFDHGGMIAVESAPGSGTTFIIDLPLDQEGSGPA